jgi:predicted transposase/invertase (TIGR01784 family)
MAADTGLVDLELTVTVYNIKDGRNANILKGCNLLREYGIFTDMVRENSLNKKMELKAAIRKAVEDCIAQNILRDFLKKHKQEVIRMLLAEWDLDTALAVRGEESFRMGKEEGKAEAKVDTARRFLSLGVDVNIISQATELPVETILKL